MTSHMILAVLAAVILIKPALGVWHLAPRSRAAWRYLPAAIWQRIRWRWLCRSLMLAYLDQHRRARRPAVPFGTSVKVKTPHQGQHAKLRYPRAAFTPDAYGWTVRVRSIPKVGRDEFDKNARYLADQWKAARVQVSQPKPGRIDLRAIRRDPLLVPLAHDGTFAEHFPRELRLGLDEFAAWRSLRLGRNTTGVIVAGLPGTGKSSLINGWLCDLAGTPAAKFWLIDGKGAADYDDWADRAEIVTGDDPLDAENTLLDVHEIMRKRLATVRQSGARNMWAAGHPSPAWPLLAVVVDECHTFLSVDAVKGDRDAEARVRRTVMLLSQLIRKGGSVGVLVILASQKVTGDAVPTVLRDNCALAVCFAVKTIEAAVAALGDQIRQHPTYAPMLLQGPEHVGVCVASLRTGLMPFVRLRVPELSEQAVAARAMSVSPAEAPAAQIEPVALHAVAAEV